MTIMMKPVARSAFSKRRSARHTRPDDGPQGHAATLEEG